MNSVSPVASSQNVQTSGAKKVPQSQQKSNVGKYVGVTTGALGGATGAYFLNSYVNEKKDLLLKGTDFITGVAKDKILVITDAIEYINKEYGALAKEKFTQIKWGVGTALIAIPALVGLGFGAIIDFMRNKNKSTK